MLDVTSSDSPAVNGQTGGWFSSAVDWNEERVPAAVHERAGITIVPFAVSCTVTVASAVVAVAITRTTESTVTLELTVQEQQAVVPPPCTVNLAQRGWSIAILSAVTAAVLMSEVCTPTSATSSLIPSPSPIFVSPILKWGGTRMAQLPPLVGYRLKSTIAHVPVLPAADMMATPTTG